MRIKKSGICILIAVLVFSFSMQGTHAFTPGLGNFVFIRSYDGSFGDVTEADWFFSPVCYAYRTGLVNGVSSTAYNPSGSITLAESIALACRLNRIYNTGYAAFEEGSPWYQVYIDYAEENGIKTDFPDYSRSAARSEFVEIIAGSVPDEAFEPLIRLPMNCIYDIPGDAEYRAEAYKLYEAGILEGSDERAGFYPDSDIKRSEAAAIAARVASRDQRSVSKLERYAREGKLDTGRGFALSGLPEYSGWPYVIVNNNIPSFSDEDISSSAYEYYGELDEKGRCTGAVANIGPELMPSAPRGSIGMIRPSGWQTVRYDGIIDGNYLYNRCHLIAYQLTGEGTNERNLITGTRYMNTTGMLRFEEEVAYYIKSTGNHVLYRSVPYFSGDELVARGIHIEALSVEDGGKGVCFNVFVFNVQPGIIINYKNGSSRASGE